MNRKHAGGINKHFFKTCKGQIKSKKKCQAVEIFTSFSQNTNGFYVFKEDFAKQYLHLLYLYLKANSYRWKAI
jgi:hypothetical protein